MFTQALLENSEAQIGIGAEFTDREPLHARQK